MRLTLWYPEKARRFEGLVGRSEAGREGWWEKKKDRSPLLVIQVDSTSLRDLRTPWKERLTRNGLENDLASCLSSLSLYRISVNSNGFLYGFILVFWKMIVQTLNPAFWII